MANTKQISIGGICPFNLGQHTDLVIKLGQMNTPGFGLRIGYSHESVELRPNDTGGKTAMYRFDIDGVEAVSSQWLQGLVDCLKGAGCEISNCHVYDLDGEQNVTLNL